MIRQRLSRFLILPLLGYTCCYVVLTFPLIARFNTYYFASNEDGLQMIWNIWWVKYALSHLHQSIFYTTMLHAPGGAPLWLHSLSPINGLLGVPLSVIFSPIQVYNSLIVLAFATSGLTAFLLCYDQTHRYWPSLAGGYAFVFTGFHFAHSADHLHQITTQFFPLYLLLILRLLRTPTIKLALGAAVTLFLVLMSDPYQFAYCGMLSVLLFGIAYRNGLDRRTWVPLCVLAVASLLLCGPLLWPMWQASREPVRGVHAPIFFSLDLLNILIPGASWQYADLTRPIWQPIQQYNEKDVAVFWAALIAAVAARKRFILQPALWWTIAGLFTLLAFGPVLHILKHEVIPWMPYRLLELLPMFKLGGCPVRMMMVVHLAIAVLAAAGLARLGSLRVIKQSRWRMTALATFCIAMVVQSQPGVQHTYPPDAPKWVYVLRDLPFTGAVVEMRTNEDPVQLYYQTIHQRPMAFGYLSRVPDRIRDVDEQIRRWVAQGNYPSLAREGFGCLVVSPLIQPAALPLLYEDKQVRIYRLPPVR